jgi:hypothetical protein
LLLPGPPAPGVAFALELRLPPPFQLALALTVEDPLPAGLDEGFGMVGLDPGVLVVEHAAPGALRRPGRAGAGRVCILVEELSGPTHPAMLVEPPVGVQYPGGRAKPWPLG